MELIVALSASPKTNAARCSTASPITNTPADYDNTIVALPCVSGGGGGGGGGKISPTPPAAKNHKQELPMSEADLAKILSLLTSAATHSLRFLSDNDLILSPSQSLKLDAFLLSATLSISTLYSLLRLPYPSETLARPKPAHWFLRFLSSTSDSDPRWLESFRMSRPSFYLLLQTLTPSLQNNPSTAPLPPDHKLGAALFRLAHAAPFRHVCRRFGLDSPASACRTFYEVCRAVADQLGHLFELSSDIKRVVQGFNWMSLPSCCGVLGYSRFSVEANDLRAERSVIAQAVVDSEGRFLDVSVGWPGMMHPAQILLRTKLFSDRAKELLNSGPSGGIEGNGGTVAVPRYLLGDSCCPLLPWLLTPFQAADLNSSVSRRIFNDIHGQGMELVPQAFGGARARWRLLSTRWKEDCIEALPFVIVASCLLHNFLFKCREPIPDDTKEPVREDRFRAFEGKGDEDSQRIRQALASHLSTVGSFLLPTPTCSAVGLKDRKKCKGSFVFLFGDPCLDWSLKFGTHNPQVKRRTQLGETTLAK